jgi:hypothetical protein
VRGVTTGSGTPAEDVSRRRCIRLVIVMRWWQHRRMFTKRTGLESWFLHEKLVLALLSEQEAVNLIQRIPDPEQPFAHELRVDLYERALTDYLTHRDVASLDVEHFRGRLKEGEIVWLEQAIAFKGLGAAVEDIRRGGNRRASFSARLATDTSVRVVGTYSAARLSGASSVDQLSGTKRNSILGYVQTITDDKIELRPIVIGQRWLRPAPEIDDWNPVDALHVWPSSVDQFAGVDFKTRLTTSHLNALKNIPETAVKGAFADIIGEPDVPKDWGGEQFDLWTSRLSVQGHSLRAAFAFKGPAKFYPMTIATLGKNGDQIERLAQTAADLMVVQHCHSIKAQVVTMLKAFASNSQNPKRYMIIDGYDTVRILRHFGHIE